MHIFSANKHMDGWMDSRQPKLKHLRYLFKGYYAPFSKGPFIATQLNSTRRRV